MANPTEAELLARYPETAKHLAEEAERRRPSDVMSPEEQNAALQFLAEQELGRAFYPNSPEMRHEPAEEAIKRIKAHAKAVGRKW